MNQRVPSAIDKYLQYGDRTPPLGVLDYCKERIPKDDSANSVVLADVHIDASTQDPKNSAMHLSTAEGLLHDVVDHTNHLLRNGHNHRAEYKSVSAVAAGLRIIDLQKYKSWARDGVAVNNYADTVATVSALATFSRAAGADDKIREYFPVLFAARSIFRAEAGLLPFAAGRLALSREDMRPLSAQGLNPRWDCGLFSPDQVYDFTSPSKKVQVKTGKKRHAEEYAKAGVDCLSLRDFGLQDTFRVLDRCSLELGLPKAKEGEPISSRELDIRTNRLLTALAFI